ncbi:hypothetical protein BK669_19005 [Pseudomonas fluorescens]|uniref:hypothetical protein n=1 Tax=Pseudomonas koreensis TaxID=198620 RepID=UPI000FEF225C|nr:hypothetical protein BK669_19005 [Pseudomonas fluorescens]
MEDIISVTLTLTRIEACRLLDNARLLQVAQFKKHWDDERFSSIPVSERRPALYTAIPAMSAQQQLITVLSCGIWAKNRR